MALLPLLRKDGTTVGHAVVDDDVFAEQCGYTWRLSSKGYAIRYTHREAIRLHRVVLGLSPDDPRQGDHIDRNRLDDRRANLRVVTHAENRQNTGAHSDSTSRYRGVTWSKRDQLWKASIWVDGHNRSLGCFKSEDEAGRAAAAGRRRHMPFSTEASA